MSLVLTNVKAWLDGYDVSGRLNQIGLEYGAELPDATVFGNSTRIRAGGLKTVRANLQGYVDFADEDIDEQLHGRIGIANTVLSFSPDGGEAGEAAYTFRAALGSYEQGGQVGEMYAFRAEAEGTDGVGLLRGIVGHNGTVTADGSGTAFNLGPLSAGQRLYAALHVLGMSASDSIIVKVQSDDAQAMSSPTDRITFASLNAIGADFASVSGAITDTWWRVAWDVTGTGVSIPFVVVLAVK